MIKLQSEIEGKRARFGHLENISRSLGIILGGNWEYHSGIYDTILWRENGETIYLRLPFRVIEGVLDDKNALIEFQTPYVIKHIVNIGLDKDENSLISATGFNQFQKPLDTDAQIRDKSRWEMAGEEYVNNILPRITFH